MASSILARRARLSTFGDLINASGGGSVRFYPAPMAASPEDAAASAPLATVALAPVCGVVGQSGNLATFTITPVSGNGSAGGVVAWARFVNGAGVAIHDEPAGLPGSGAPVIVTDGQPTPAAQVFVGGEVRLVSAVFVE